MLALLIANQIILGKFTYSQVPEALRPAVKAVLDEAGVGFLADLESEG